jgi:hypothetical protein
LPAQDFDRFANAGEFWLHKGASLFRAALVLQRQDMADSSNLLDPTTAWRPRAGLSQPACMLAAMAVECALKAVIAEKQGVATGGRLDRDTPKHGLGECQEFCG